MNEQDGMNFQWICSWTNQWTIDCSEIIFDWEIMYKKMVWCVGFDS